jgi:uncharacterized protein YqgC (DUF456 family)
VTALLIIIGILLILVGLAGLILPALPGAPLIFAGALAIAAAHDFTRIGVFTLVVIGLLALMSMVLDHAITLLGARRAGASAWGMLGAVLGLLVGFFFGLPGIIVGPAVGAVVFEYWQNPNFTQASRAGMGVFIGFLVGTLVKYTLAFAIIGIVVFAYLV